MANDEENKQLIESSETVQESAELKQNEQTDTTVTNQENTQETVNQDILLDDGENLTQKKAKKLNKVLVIVVGVLVGVLLIGLILFFIGVFDSEEEPTATPANASSEQQATSQTPDGTNQATQQPVEIAIPSYEFKTTDINVPRLNKKLQALVDAPIVGTENDSEELTQVIPQNLENNVAEGTFFDEELEALLPKEEQIQKNEQPIIATTEQTTPIDLEQNTNIVNNTVSSEVQTSNVETKTVSEPKKEELVDNKNIDKESKGTKKEVNQVTTVAKTEQPSNNNKTTNTKHEPEIKKNGNSSSHFLKFIQVATLKYQLYTQFLREIKAVDARISICQNNDGRIQIFIGPFLDDKQRSFVIEQINKSVVNDAFGLEFTQEEYFRRCGIKDPS